MTAIILIDFSWGFSCLVLLSKVNFWKRFVEDLELGEGSADICSSCLLCK